MIPSRVRAPEPAGHEPDMLLSGRRFVRLVLFWALVGLIFAVQTSLLIYAETGKFRPWLGVFWEVAGWLMWVPLTPIAARLARRYPFDRSRWGKRLLVHVGAAAVLCVAEVAVFFAIRTAGAWLVGEPEFQFARAFRATVWRSFPFDFFIYMTIVAVVHAREYYRKFLERDVQTAQLETQLAQAQLQTLRMQLNPHFLFNTLHAISALMDDDVKGARRMMASLSELLRLSLDNAGEQEVPLEQELRFLDRYLQIEQVRFQDRLTVSMDVAPETLHACVPNLILQPLVENAIKHGIAPYSAAGRIEIRAAREDGRLHLKVYDNGPGLRRNHSGVIREGVGLKNTRERLRQLYGDDHRFALENADAGGLAVSITIPFRPDLDDPASATVHADGEDSRIDRRRRTAGPQTPRQAAPSGA